MVFEQGGIRTSEKSYRRIDLLRDVGTIRSFGKHLVDFIEHSTGFLDSHEDFFFSFWVHHHLKLHDHSITYGAGII